MCHRRHLGDDCGRAAPCALRNKGSQSWPRSTEVESNETFRNLFSLEPQSFCLFTLKLKGRSKPLPLRYLFLGHGTNEPL